MTSTILSNKNLMPAFRFELKRIWFCFIVFPVLSIIGLAAVFGITVKDGYYLVRDSASEVADITKNIAYNGGYFMIILMALGCALIISNIYSSFYSKRKTDFFQSLPVTRSAQYLAKSLALFSVTAASYFIAAICVLALNPFIPSKINVSVNTLLVLKYFFVAFIISVALICVAQFCAVTAGKKWQYWLLLLGVAVCLPIAAVNILSIPGHFLVGSSFKLSNLGGVISPALLYVLAIGKSFRLRYIILFGIIISAVSFLFGWRLLLKRKSECAEQSVSSQSVVVLAVFGAMGCAASLVYILPLKQKQFIVIAVLAAAAAVAAAVICGLIYNRKEIKKPVAAVTVVTAFVIFAAITVCGSGGFGYASKVPDADMITSVSVNIGSQTSSVFKGDTPFSIADIQSNGEYYEIHDFKDESSFDQIVKFQQECIKKSKNTPANGVYNQVYFIYRLSNGKKLKRVYEAPENATYSLSAVSESKQNKGFVKAGIDNICSISYQSNVYSASELADAYLDIDEYYPALVSDYMKMTEADFRQSDNDMTGISTINLSVYYATEYATAEQKSEFSKMTPRQLENYYVDHFMNESKSALASDSVVLPITMPGVTALLKEDGYIIESKKFSEIKADDIEKMLVANVDYSESQQLYNIGSGYSAETIYIFGSDVVKKGFGREDDGIFDGISDKEIISKTFSLVRDNVDQYTLFKQNNKTGYAVVFCMKDGSFSKVYYVPEVPGYQGLE